MNNLNAGFIGLGHMGKAMVRRLISEGVNLTVWNRTIEKAEDLDVQVANDPSGVAEGNSVVFINVRDSDAVEDVIATGGGLIKTDLSGKVLVDTTTNHFQSAEEFHEVVRARKGYYLEAPVIGSVNTVLEGKLTIFVSGDESALDHAKPFLDLIGDNIFYLEIPGRATRMKLINNLVLASFMASLSEATLLGEEVGMEKDRVLELLSAGAGNSVVLDAKKEKLLSGDFSPHFSNDLMYKDLRLAHELASDLEHPIFTGSVVKELFATALQSGRKDLDFSSIYRVLEGNNKNRSDSGNKS